MTATADPTLPLDLLAASVTGAVHLPGTPEYAAAATPWNVSVPASAAAVLVAANADDVSHAMRFAATHGLRVTVQATGHGAVLGEGPTLLVSTAGLRELAIDVNGRARVGAGHQWSDVIAAAAPLGYAGLAGSSPGVGVVGFLTGGGLGPVARTYGVSADHVTAFDVVTGDGEVRRASATENPDLFWALRGGKGALGIVTAVEFDLVPLTEILGGCLYFAADDVAAVTHAWAGWTAGLDERATSSLAILRLPPMPGVPEPLAGTVTAAVRFAWVGDVEAGRAALAPMLAVAPPVLGGVDVMPYSALGMIHNDPVDPMPTTEAATLFDRLPGEAVDGLLRLAGPGSACAQVMVEVRHLGGAIGRCPEQPSAFDHRDAGYSLLTVGIAAPPVAEATVADARALLAGMAEWTTGRCLPNFVATGDPAQVARKYRPETLRRLASLAQAYDPHGVVAAAVPVRAAARA